MFILEQNPSLKTVHQLSILYTCLGPSDQSRWRVSIQHTWLQYSDAPLDQVCLFGLELNCAVQ